MQTSIATVSLSGGLAEKLEAIAAAGFTGVEIFESDLLSFNGTAKDVARIVASLGLKIVTFQPFRDFEGMPEPQRARVFDRAERKFDVMQELGTDLMLVDAHLQRDEFKNRIIKVRVINDEGALVGRTVWIGLKDTSFVDDLDPQSDTVTPARPASSATPR